MIRHTPFFLFLWLKLRCPTQKTSSDPVARRTASVKLASSIPGRFREAATWASQCFLCTGFSEKSKSKNCKSVSRNKTTQKLGFAYPATLRETRGPSFISIWIFRTFFTSSQNGPKSRSSRLTLRAQPEGSLGPTSDRVAECFDMVKLTTPRLHCTYNPAIQKSSSRDTQVALPRHKRA